MRLFSLLLCVMGLFGVFGCAAEAVEGRNRSPLTVHRSRASEGAEGVFAAAIRGRRPVAFDYSGVARVAHPHRMGPSAAGNGKTLVRCWEVTRGGEATGTWKLFEVGKASAPRLLPGTFEPAPGYTPRDRAIPEPEEEIPADD